MIKKNIQLEIDDNIFECAVQYNFFPEVKFIRGYSPEFSQQGQQSEFEICALECWLDQGLVDFSHRIDELSEQIIDVLERD